MRVENSKRHCGGSLGVSANFTAGNRRQENERAKEMEERCEDEGAMRPPTKSSARLGISVPGCVDGEFRVCLLSHGMG